MAYLISQVGNDQINAILLETLRSLSTLQDFHTRGTIEKPAIQSCTESVDSFIKKLNELVRKKHSLTTADRIFFSNIKAANKKWDNVKK